jgi:hypothetical protein
MVSFITSILASLLIESDKVVSGQEKYNMATFMVLFLLITIEVMVVKVVTAETERDDESPGVRAADVFFDREDN